MFDVGFSELCLIGLVSLLVIGPERLPKVARLAGFWLGKTRSMMASVKAEIKQELQAEEFRQIVKEHAAMKDDCMDAGGRAMQGAIAEFQQVLDETSDAAHSIKSSLEQPLPEDSVEQVKRQHEPE